MDTVLAEVLWQDARVPQLPVERHLLRAKDFADLHYAEAVDVPAMARVAGLSTAHFSRLFKATFGESPHSYVLTRRLERAASLLRTTDRRVLDICVMVGFSSLGSFTTSFTRMYGRSPSMYREAHPPAAARVVVPECIARAYARPEKRSFREDAATQAS